MTCRFCQQSVELVENVGSKTGLGSIWMFQCQNESCPSHETNLPFPTMKKMQGARDKLCIGSWLSSYRWRSRDSLKGFKFSWSIVASYADALWARHAIFLPHERLLKRMGCLIRPITADFPIKAANFEP